MNVIEQYNAIKVKAADLAAQAEDRDFTPEEMAAAIELKSQAEELEPKVKQAKGDAAVRDAIKTLGENANAPQPAADSRAGGEPTTAAPQVKAVPAWAASPDRGIWVKSVMDQVQRVQDSVGKKALIGNSIDVGTPIETEIVTFPEVPRRFLDLLVQRKSITTENFDFIRQTLRENNAASVADGELKPRSRYTVGLVSDNVRVIAHLSEKIPERIFSDHAELELFLQNEMEAGLLDEVERQVVSGDGTGAAADGTGGNMTGILATSGILHQAWSGDLLGTVRKSLTAMALIGETPNAVVVNPADAELIDLLTDTQSRFYYGGPQQQLGGVGGNGTAPLWSHPIVQSLAVEEGQALVGNFSFLTLVEREGATLDVNRAGDGNFDRNLVELRLEGRWGVQVRRPSAFCTVATAAA